MPAATGDDGAITQDAMIPLLPAATRIAGRQMTPQHLNARHASVERASRLPARHHLERKVTAHAELFKLGAWDADGAAHEVERNLKVLHYMGRLARGAGPGKISRAS